MSLLLTVRIRVGDQNSADVSNALHHVAERFRTSGYVETLRGSVGAGEINRGVINDKGEHVGEFTLQDSP